MDAATIGQAGLKGWRGKVADTVATPVAKRTSASEDQVRAVVGVLFMVLTLLYIVSTIRRMFDQD